MTGVSRLLLFIMAYINGCRGIEKLCVPAMIGSSVLSLPSGAKALERLFSSHFLLKSFHVMFGGEKEFGLHSEQIKKKKEKKRKKKNQT